jgi:transposase
MKKAFDLLGYIVDFHVVQLANKTLSLIWCVAAPPPRAGVRRGWATDPGWKTRNRLLRNREELTDEQFERMWNPLLDKGLIGQRLLTA